MTNRLLHITNGDCAVEIMKRAGIEGQFLPWRDVLHEGPVPGGLSLEALSKIRARFMIQQGWGEPAAIENSFKQRDRTLRSFRAYAKIILWFEHDLYDQLQILQLLDWFADNPPGEITLSMICTEHYLGGCTPDELKGLTGYETVVTDQQLTLAKKAWAAFRAASPESWQALLTDDIAALPFLEGAVLRQLQEYPSCANGLSRTARQALSILAQGEIKAGQLFARNQCAEERVFMGDTSFWKLLRQLRSSTPPLLELSEGADFQRLFNPATVLSITPAGREVLAGERNFRSLLIKPQWHGGVRLTPDNDWCWDSVDKVVKRVVS